MVNALAGLAAGADFAQGLQNTYDNSRLNMLSGRAYNAPQADRSQLLGQMASISPQAAQAQQQQWQADEDRQTRMLVNTARYMKGALDRKDPAAVAGAWNSVRPALIRAGLATEQELSPTWDPSYEQTVHQVLAMGGMDAGGGNGNKVVGDALVDADGNIIYQAESKAQYVDVPDGQGGTVKMLFDPRSRSFSQPDFMTGQPVRNDGAGDYRLGAGLTPEQVALAKADMAAGSTADSYQLPSRDVSPQQFGRQPRLGYTPAKPEISAAEQARLDMARRAADRADNAAREASSARQEAADQRRRSEDEKRQKAEMAAAQAASSVNDSLGTIQRLRSHPGYRQLGTVMGDAALSAPLVRTDAKGANALLETIKSQMLINTLQSLKAASSTGASGFGSLTEREGDALRAAIANLTTAQSHGDLDSAIGQVENVLKRSQQQLSASSPRQAASDRPQSNAIPQRARNPQTGQVIELRNGQWVPVQ